MIDMSTEHWRYNRKCDGATLFVFSNDVTHYSVWNRDKAVLAMPLWTDKGKKTLAART
jgi:hypothetical protein